MTNFKNQLKAVLLYRKNVMKFIYQTWWKVLAVLVILYTLIAGFLFEVPTLPILHETIRNLYFHVPMWMAMFSVFGISVVFSIMYLNTGKEEYDLASVECVNTGMMFFVLSLVTGMMWPKYTKHHPGVHTLNRGQVVFLFTGI